MALNASAAKFNQCTLVLVLMLLIVKSINSVQAQRSCQTPDRQNGRCVHYKQCSVVVSQLTRYGQAIPQSFMTEIRTRRRSCETNGSSQIIICCETRYLDQTTTTTERVIRETNLKDINQRGLDVLRTMNCGRLPENRVAFGEPTDLEEFPWLALLRYDSNEKWNCGGTLITNRYVLTAAHCTADPNKKVIGVRLGEHDLSTDRDCQIFGDMQKCSPPVEDFGIDKIITHPEYKFIKNDIALIRLDRDVECKSHIKPVCLPITDKSRVLTNIHEYFIAGWGTTEKGTTSKVLLKALVPHQTVSFCQSTFGGNSDINDNHICAGGKEGKATCQGDSGGPLFYQAPYSLTPKFVQYGVVSYGVKGCGTSSKSYPTIYTKIEAFLPWITNHLAEYDISTASKSCKARTKVRLTL